MTAAIVILDAVIAVAVIVVLLAGRGPGQDVRPIRVIPISRRVPPVAAGRAPFPAGAPEAPASDSPVPGAGASPQLRPGDPPWWSAARSGPGQPRPAAPGEPAPASPGGGRRAPRVITQDPPGTRRQQPPRRFLPDEQVAVWEAGGYHIHHRDTAPLPAVRAGVFSALEAWRDEAVNVR